MPQRPASTKEQLIRVAAQQFAANGYEGTSMRKIASAVGIQAASIFHHFPDGKSQLYDEIVQQVIDTLTNKVVDWNIDADDPVETIVEACILFWDFFEGNEAAASVLLRDAFDPKSPRGKRIREQSENIQAIATQFIAAAQKRGQIRAFNPSAFMFWACVYVLNFHGTTGIRESIWPQLNKKQLRSEACQHFVGDVRHYLLAS